MDQVSKADGMWRDVDPVYNCTSSPRVYGELCSLSPAKMHIASLLANQQPCSQYRIMFPSSLLLVGSALSLELGVEVVTGVGSRDVEAVPVKR